MSQTITLTVSDQAIHHAREIASQIKWPVEDVLSEFVALDVIEPLVEQFSDKLVLALCEAQLPAEQDAELSALLDDQREGQLNPAKRSRLDELMSIHCRGSVRKAYALRVAVQRGLRPPLE